MFQLKCVHSLCDYFYISGWTYFHVRPQSYSLYNQDVLGTITTTLHVLGAGSYSATVFVKCDFTTTANLQDTSSTI